MIYDVREMFELDKQATVELIREIAAQVQVDLNLYTDDELKDLYNQFSEDVWAASWEDNAEGQFVEWMFNNGYANKLSFDTVCNSHDKNICIDCPYYENGRCVFDMALEVEDESPH